MLGLAIAVAVESTTRVDDDEPTGPCGPEDEPKRIKSHHAAKSALSALFAILVFSHVISVCAAINHDQVAMVPSAGMWRSLLKSKFYVVAVHGVRSLNQDDLGGAPLPTVTSRGTRNRHW